MAKAPKAPTRSKPAGPKPASKPKTPVEDAVVIEETPAEASKSAKPADAEPTPDGKNETPAEGTVAETTKRKADEVPTAEAVEPNVDAEEAPTRPAPEAPKHRGPIAPFLGFLLGGVAAAVIGFAAARYVVPEGWPFPGVAPEEDPVAAAVEVQGTEIAGLSERIDGLNTSVSALEADTGLDRLRVDLTNRLDGLEASFTDAITKLDEIETRLAAVEKLAPEGSAAAQMAAEAYDRELKALREMFEGELAKVEAAQADAAGLQVQAAEATKAASGRAALARITTALDTGASFAEALADISASTGIVAPQALAAVADSGVPSLAALQEAFPVAARAALDASVRAGVDSGDVSRFTAFLQTQLGARSLEPKEGDDADAVLSRAEAALRQGDIATALTELDALPEAGQPAMADWRAEADTRKAALEAASALADELNAK